VKLLGVLNNRERRIFEARGLADEPVTLEALGDEFGVSRERVRQIEERAFEKVKRAAQLRVAALTRPSAGVISTMDEIGSAGATGRVWQFQPKSSRVTNYATAID
jgi:hypothetical protein